MCASTTNHCAKFMHQVPRSDEQKTQTAVDEASLEKQDPNRLIKSASGTGSKRATGLPVLLGGWLAATVAKNKCSASRHCPGLKTRSSFLMACCSLCSGAFHFVRERDRARNCIVGSCLCLMDHCQDTKVMIRHALTSLSHHGADKPWINVGPDLEIPGG